MDTINKFLNVKQW